MRLRLELASKEPRSLVSTPCKFKRLSLGFSEQVPKTPEKSRFREKSQGRENMLSRHRKDVYVHFFYLNIYKKSGSTKMFIDIASTSHSNMCK
jgi:hypothetical protein